MKLIDTIGHRERPFLFVNCVSPAKWSELGELQYASDGSPWDLSEEDVYSDCHWVDEGAGE